LWRDAKNLLPDNQLFQAMNLKQAVEIAFSIVTPALIDSTKKSENQSLKEK